MKAETVESRVAKRIVRKRGDVFLRTDFNDLGGYDQVGRVLRQLVTEGKLLRIGQGVYTRAVNSPFDIRPIPPRGLDTLKEALGRLGVDVSPTRFEQAYNSGLSTQVPSGRRVAVSKRIRRKIGYNGITLSFERARPEPR